MLYKIIGDDSAPDKFEIDEVSGAVTVADDLTRDAETVYVVSVEIHSYRMKSLH